MKKRYMFYALIIAASTHQVFAAVPPVDNRGVPAIITCPTSATGVVTPARAYHSDKIVFMITDKLLAASDVDQQALSALPFNTPLDIKVRDNPVAVADIKSKVLTFLGASIDPNSGNGAKINILNVEYAAVVCPKTP